MRREICEHGEETDKHCPECYKKEPEYVQSYIFGKDAENRSGVKHYGSDKKSLCGLYTDTGKWYIEHKDTPVTCPKCLKLKGPGI